MMNGDAALRPYLLRSAALHAGLVLVFLIAVRLPRPASDQVFRIDFVGPSSVIINRTTESAAGSAKPAASAAEKIPPQAEKNEFGASRHHAPLPRPSVLSESASPKATSPAPAASPAVAPASSSSGTSGAAGEGPADAAVDTEMPNFPYPWYISQVRSALWGQWKQRMPSGGGETTVQFTILKDGSAVDVRVESSSGDSSFDYVALGAVQSAMPFPPLPQGFSDRFLKIHVRFKSQ